MTILCPECKNTCEFQTLKEKQIVECEMCGITLEVTAIEGDKAQVEIVDEGK